MPHLRKISSSSLTGLAVLEPDVPSGAFSGMILHLEWNGVRFQACALETEAVYNPKLSALQTVLRLKIINGPEISSLDIQAWIRETKAPVVPLRGIDGMDNRHFGQLVAALRNGHTYAVAEWKDQGKTKERVLLAPLNEGLICAAFVDDGIPKRPTQQPQRPIRVLKRQPGPQQAHVQAQQDQLSVSQDDMDVDGDEGGWLPAAGAAGSLARSSDRFGYTHAIVLDTGGDTGGTARRVGEFATSRPGANLEPWNDLYDKFLDLNL
ncbi:hypothetical protein DFH94DRAFT_158493 [Russula ochroleuca]|uniref:Uncharacterized protein n=1 Tax=Russula ochroleuca TaxID=152965 RepID=A0A9P5N423_9AGAM|nr:hypothetical protein DFH94DRAFT_158493 [Russula ochroleuca]